MAGIRLEIPVGAVKAKYIQLTLSEELDGVISPSQCRTTQSCSLCPRANPQ